jgi:putative transposase
MAKEQSSPDLPKTMLAKQLGIARSSLYYQRTKPEQDWQLKQQIEAVLKDHPSYGYRRIALELKRNKKQIQRVMHNFGMKPYRRRGRSYKKAKENGQVFPNLLQLLEFPKAVNLIWVSDFTHFSWHGKQVYLATVMDICDRTVVGWSVLTAHPVQLTLLALIDAIEKYGRPKVLHSDQGSEYKSKVYTSFAQDLGVQLSMSHRGSPWENGYQESFYDKLKIDFGDPNRFKTLGELVAAIYLQLYYYNTKRIHGKLKMPPKQYAQAARLTTNPLPVRL